jgi:transposase-like protein
MPRHTHRNPSQNRWSRILAMVDYEPNLGVCLMMMHLSKERTILVCYQFFKQLTARYCRKPIFTDGAYWYNTTCRWLRLPHKIYRPELKNMMERFIQQIKDRTECFDDHFPCKKVKICKILHLATLNEHRIVMVY